ncbi:uncharacterized protein LOC141561876 [Sminthopsis crassicaudata]|uniref:uncharacterized protein LOC141561876 n=1 Tax=Sminthopsis crassicaudata TaxID=9301 RepID=UPI003D69334C
MESCRKDPNRSVPAPLCLCVSVREEPRFRRAAGWLSSHWRTEAGGTARRLSGKASPGRAPGASRCGHRPQRLGRCSPQSGTASAKPSRTPSHRHGPRSPHSSPSLELSLPLWDSEVGGLKARGRGFLLVVFPFQFPRVKWSACPVRGWERLRSRGSHHCCPLRRKAGTPARCESPENTTGARTFVHAGTAGPQGRNPGPHAGLRQEPRSYSRTKWLS